MSVKTYIRGRIVFWTSLGSLALVSASLAGDCGQCSKEIAQLSEKEKERQKTVELLGKNRAYLAGLSAKEASRYLKVSSNVMMILKKLDTIGAESEKSRGRIKALGCQSCGSGESL